MIQEEGMPPRQAASEGMRELSGAVCHDVGMAVFLPALHRYNTVLTPPLVVWSHLATRPSSPLLPWTVGAVEGFRSRQLVLIGLIGA